MSLKQRSKPIEKKQKLKAQFVRRAVATWPMDKDGDFDFLGEHNAYWQSKCSAFDNLLR